MSTAATRASAPLAAAQVDHLVVVADNLAQGVAWCEATLGVVPVTGGTHALMGTHNRVLRLQAPGGTAYLEVIAIDPAATPPGHARWFDMDDAALREAVKAGPRLAHFVARTTTADAALQRLQALGIDRGPLVAAERPTPTGVLRWKLTVRGDGQRLFYGGLPTLIEWGDAVHPALGLADDGLSLRSFAMHHPRPDALRAACEAIGFSAMDIEAGAPSLVATLDTPRGRVVLESKGL